MKEAVEGAPDAATDKAAWRSRLLARRRGRPVPQIAAARGQLATHLTGSLAAPGTTVCAYLPLPSEPLDPSLPAVLTAAGVRVLVPVVSVAAPLDWCLWNPVDARRGPLGIVEPSGPRLGNDAIAEANAVLIPALAVDRRGVRLGRGGGHYDRSLALLERMARDQDGPRLIAVVFDDEVVDALPNDEFDRRVTELATPTRGLLTCPVASEYTAGASSD